MSPVRGAFAALMVIVLAVALVPGAAEAKKKRRPSYDKGYGFLPGYPPKKEPRRERQWIFYGAPGHWHYYRGRLMGPTFGPCWKQTPIGPTWICG